MCWCLGFIRRLHLRLSAVRAARFSASCSTTQGTKTAQLTTKSKRRRARPRARPCSSAAALEALPPHQTLRDHSLPSPKEAHEMGRGRDPGPDASLLYPGFLPPTPCSLQKRGGQSQKLSPKRGGGGVDTRTNSPRAPTIPEAGSRTRPPREWPLLAGAGPLAPAAATTSSARSRRTRTRTLRRSARAAGLGRGRGHLTISPRGARGLATPLTDTWWAAQGGGAGATPLSLLLPPFPPGPRCHRSSARGGGWGDRAPARSGPKARGRG